MKNALTIDVEDWFNILDSSAVPSIEQWDSLESRVEKNMESILEILNAHSIQATFFWLGWVAERHKSLVRKCLQEGHEIASHGYGHVLAFNVGREAFREDIVRAKNILEDITGLGIAGFRAPGFGITNKSDWAFDVIGEIYEYDSSVFPAVHGHGGIIGSPVKPHLIRTMTGDLTEIPMSTIEILGRRISLFGGGYLRLAPKRLISWGIDELHNAGQPLIVYLHPREIDPHHPRLPLSLIRSFKSYVGLNSTMPKLRWLCENYNFTTMKEIADTVTV